MKRNIKTVEPAQDERLAPRDAALEALALLEQAHGVGNLLILYQLLMLVHIASYQRFLKP